jgi:hypothetical protein
MKTAFYLPRSIIEVKKLFRLMVLKVLTFNRDDHAKNFSFLLKNSKWSSTSKRQHRTRNIQISCRVSARLSSEPFKLQEEIIIHPGKYFDTVMSEYILSYQKVRSAIIEFIEIWYK